MKQLNLLNYVNEEVWYGEDYYSATSRAFYKSAARIIEKGMKSEDGCIPYLTKASNTLQFLKILDEAVEEEKGTQFARLLEKQREIELDDEPIKSKTNRLTALNKKIENEENAEIKSILQKEIDELEKSIQEQKTLKMKSKLIDDEFKKLDKSYVNTKTTDVSKQKTLIKVLVDDYAIPLSQQILMDTRKEELDGYEKSYDNAFNLVLKMFTEVYEVSEPEIAAKHLLHSLINCKRGIYGMERKEQTLLALIGGQGTGKSSFLYSLDRVINGKRTGSTRFENLIGKFTSSKMNENFMVFTEESPAFDRSQTSALKDLITCEEYSFERKGKDVINLRKNAQMFICANDNLNNLFYLDGSSRRLSRVYLNGIKVKMSSEKIDKMIEKIWFAIPLSFPYDTMDFVKTYNENAIPDETIWEDELSTLIGKYRSEINDDWLNKCHTRKEWMLILESHSIVRVEKFLNKENWFIKGSHNHMNTYKPTDELKNIIKDCEAE